MCCACVWPVRACVPACVIACVCVCVRPDATDYLGLALAAAIVVMRMQISVDQKWAGDEVGGLRRWQRAPLVCELPGRLTDLVCLFTTVS